MIVTANRKNTTTMANLRTLPLCESNRLYNEDNVLTMERMPDNFVDIVVTSPPYNVGKEYEEQVSLEEWKTQMRATFSQTMRVLVHGGRICINVANTGRNPYNPLHSFLISIMLDLGFFMRGEIVWDKGPSVGPSTAWGSWLSAANPVIRDTHEYILVFHKGQPKKPKSGTDTISRSEFLASTKSIWSIETESAKRIGHPCPFPVKLPERLIDTFSFEGNLVYDPFMGSGTTAIAAIKLKRNWIGSEINARYCDLADQRIAEFLSQGTLF